MSLLFAYVFCLLVISTQAFGNIPEGYRECNNRTWKFFSTTDASTVNWTAAERRCAVDGSQLAIVESDADRNCMESLSPKSVLDGWIGFNDQPEENNYLWLNGQRVSKGHWAPGQPNPNDGFNCGFAWTRRGQLGLLRCDRKRLFLCQFPAEEYKRCGDRLWKYYPFNLDWHSAKSRCALDGAKLARIENEEEQECSKQLTSRIRANIKIWVSMETVTGSRQCAIARSKTTSSRSLTARCTALYSFMCIKDINECLRGLHKCDRNAHCGNTDGSYNCKCKDGFTGNGTIYHCTDINECSTGLHKCDINADCVNTNGSYNCNCNDGLTGNGTIHHCADINECLMGFHKCDTNGHCANTKKSYSCKCNDGFTGNGTIYHCTDINECLTGFHRCDRNAYCVNTNGSYNCKCRNGFTGNATIHNCIDIRGTSKSTDDSTRSLGPAIGGTVGGIMFLIIILLIFLWQRKNGQEKGPRTITLEELYGVGTILDGRDATIIANNEYVTSTVHYHLYENINPLMEAENQIRPVGTSRNGRRKRKSDEDDKSTRLLQSTADHAATANTEGIYSLAGPMAESLCLDNVSERESIYHPPATTQAGVYRQLTGSLYRHLSRACISLLEDLGEGDFGPVYVGLWKQRNGFTKKTAVKTLKEDCTPKQRVRFLQEAFIMGQFRHENIVALHGLVAHGKPLLLVYELMRCNLRKYLLSMRNPDGGDPTLLSMCSDIAGGMAYLAKKGFVHRALAAKNIMVDGKRTCKIGGFDMACDWIDEDYYSSRGGILVEWTAPETPSEFDSILRVDIVTFLKLFSKVTGVKDKGQPQKKTPVWEVIQALNYQQYLTASDIWSYGVVLYEIYSFGKKPYSPWPSDKVLKEVQDGYRLPKPDKCPASLYNIMLDCWNADQNTRPSFDEILQLLPSS